MHPSILCIGEALPRDRCGSWCTLSRHTRRVGQLAHRQEMTVVNSRFAFSKRSWLSAPS